MSHALPLVLAALGAELLLLLLGLLALSWWRNRAARRRDEQAIRTLVARAKSAKGERQAVIARFLTDRVGLSGEPLQQCQVELLRAERRLLQRLAAVYHRRDAEAAASLDLDVYAALEPYHALQMARTAPAAEVDSGELDGLRAENSDLKEELRITMQNMSRMVNDYSEMFSAPAPPVETSEIDTVGVGSADDQSPPMVDHGDTALADAMPTADSDRVAPPQDAALRLEEGPVEVVGLDEGDDFDAAAEEAVFEALEATAAVEGDGEPQPVSVDDGTEGDTAGNVPGKGPVGV